MSIEDKSSGPAAAVAARGVDQKHAVMGHSALRAASQSTDSSVSRGGASNLHQPAQPDLRAALATIPGLTMAAGDVLAERQRQVTAEHWAPEHDDEHTLGELAKAAACYALGAQEAVSIGGARVHLWPWEPEAWKPAHPRRMLVKAAALLLAEIERLDRAEAKAVS